MNYSTLFGNRSFALLLLGRVFSIMATEILNISVSWQIYEQTGRALDLGLIGLAQFLPSFLLSPLTGTVADRVDRRFIVSFCNGLNAVCAVMLLLATQFGVASLTTILLVLTVIGTARAFSFPAQQALMPNVVDRAQWGQAIALGATVNRLAALTGPALGGLLLTFGASFDYAMTATALCFAALTALFLKLTVKAPPKSPIDLQSMLGGVRFIGRRPAIFGAISMDLLAVLLGGAVAMLPIYARDILHVGPIGLGLLRSAEPVGALVVALMLSRFPPGRGAGILMICCVAGFGLATIVFGLSHSMPLSLVALATLGATDMCSVFVRMRMVQTATPDALRGRVSAISALFINASNQLGQFESGVTAAVFGVVPSVVIGGMASIAVAAGWSRLFPSLMKIDFSPQGLRELETSAEEAEVMLSPAEIK